MTHDVTSFSCCAPGVPGGTEGWKRFVQDDKDWLVFQLESESE